MIQRILDAITDTFKKHSRVWRLFDVKDRAVMLERGARKTVVNSAYGAGKHAGILPPVGIDHTTVEPEDGEQHEEWGLSDYEKEFVEVTDPNREIRGPIELDIRDDIGSVITEGGVRLIDEINELYPDTEEEGEVDPEVIETLKKFHDDSSGNHDYNMYGDNQ